VEVVSNRHVTCNMGQKEREQASI